jgi:hypothetical protein
MKQSRYLRIRLHGSNRNWASEIKNMRIQIPLIMLFFHAVTLHVIPQSLPGNVRINKIWDVAEHSAFTDLIRFGDYYYCTFREGTGHIPGADGVVRILKSPDGKTWESVALLEKTGIDLRDPKLSITPDGRIMVIMGGSVYLEGEIMGRSPQVSFSDPSGKQFSSPDKIMIDPEIASWGDWIWRTTWYKGTGYAVDYQIGPHERKGPTAYYLVKTDNGRDFTKVARIELDGYPNESTIRFDKEGIMFILIRRELDDRMGMWARSSAPYTQWEFKKLDLRLGGPNFIFTEDEETIVGTRVYEPEVYTALFSGDKDGNLREVFRLPSGGDTSYPGLLLEKDRLLVSYYSSHEGKSAIYLAEIPLDLFQNP